MLARKHWFSATALALGACAPPAQHGPNIQQAQAEVAAIKAECASQPTHLAREKCGSDRLIEINIRELGLPPDVVKALAARRLAIAEAIDLGKITETEGDAEIAEAQSRSVAEIQRRRQAAQPLVCTTASGVTVCN